MTRFATRAVHAGLEPDPTYRSVVPAIHQSTTYLQPAPGEFVEGYDYSRSANPTRTALENALGELEGGLASAFSSGMAAEHALITAVCSAGDHIVIPDDLYGGTYRLVDKVLARWGLEYTMVDQTDLDAVSAAVRAGTKLIWVETPTNPTLKVVDVPAIVASLGRRVRGGRQHVRHAGLPASVWSWAPTLPCTRRPSTSAGTRTRSAVRSWSASRRRMRPCASCRTRSAPCPGPWTAS